MWTWGECRTFGWWPDHDQPHVRPGQSRGERNNQERGLAAIILLFKIKDRVLGFMNKRERDVTAFIFLRRISLGHQEESFATPGKCNVDTSLCDRCQDSDQRRSFTWMEYWDPPASYCDTENFYSATFCKILLPDTQSFRHPFMASQLNSHYSPTLLSFSIQAQSL